MIKGMMIRGFMGVSFRELTFGPGGAVISGGNDKGKSTVLHALRAGLLGIGVDESAIKNGEDGFELYIDLDSFSVRQALTRTSRSCTVTLPDGTRRAKPRAFISEALGVSPLDPLDLFFLLKKDKAGAREARDRILSTMPITVTIEKLGPWLPDIGDPRLLVGVDTGGHGLEVVERLRSKFYDQRAVAAKDLAAISKEYAAKDKEAHALRDRVPADAPTIEEAKQEVSAAQEAIARIRFEADAAERASATQESSRARVADLRAQARKVREEAPLAPTSEEIEEAAEEIAQNKAVVEALDARIDRLKRQIEDEEITKADLLKDIERFCDKARTLDEREAEAGNAAMRALDLASQAEELEAAIGGPAEQPDPGKIERARAALEAAQARLVVAGDADALRGLESALKASRSARNRLSAEHAELDRSVKALTDEAPAELLRASDGIPGLGLKGDTITLDGVAIDLLGDAAKMKFAVQVARRQNAKSKILLVDGLERIDEDQRDAFVEACSADGFQVFLTLVTKGDWTINPIGGDK